MKKLINSLQSILINTNFQKYSIRDIICPYVQSILAYMLLKNFQYLNVNANNSGKENVVSIWGRGNRIRTYFYQSSLILLKNS